MLCNCFLELFSSFDLLCLSKINFTLMLFRYSMGITVILIAVTTDHSQKSCFSTTQWALPSNYLNFFLYLVMSSFKSYRLFRGRLTNLFSFDINRSLVSYKINFGLWRFSCSFFFWLSSTMIIFPIFPLLRRLY